MIRVAKTKVLISCAVTAKLICAFVFVKAKNHEKSGFLMTRLICLKPKTALLCPSGKTLNDLQWHWSCTVDAVTLL